MSFWTVVAIAIVCAVIFGGHNRHHRKHACQQGSAGDDGAIADDAPRKEELQREVEELRERVQVLERIATDGHEARRLSDEIESLRFKGKEKSQ